jgi:mannose-6-phosphate isomerase-like protein (cupin superfamily)
MLNRIKRFNQDQEYYFKEGCFIVEVSNSSDDPDVSIARARVEAGGSTRWHWLQETCERYVILAGEGLVEVAEDEPCKVASGDVVIIPAAARQRITNIGASDLTFLAICTPRFKQANYRSE